MPTPGRADDTLTVLTPARGTPAVASAAPPSGAAPSGGPPSGAPGVPGGTISVWQHTPYPVATNRRFRVAAIATMAATISFVLAVAVVHGRNRDELVIRPAVAATVPASGEVVAALPEGTSLFLSSSMPIREGDAYAAPRAQALRVFTNRGANGIDGIVSSALGVAVGTRRPTVLLTGDLALLHDVGALLIAHRHRVPLTAVVVNNDGGGIFSFLPIARATPHFEELFATPHGLQLEHAARLYGARYAQPSSVKGLRAEIARSVEGGLHLIEVRVDRSINPEVHQELMRRVQAALMRLGYYDKQADGIFGADTRAAIHRLTRTESRMPPSFTCPS